ncbi:MAG TPA: helix-turn-helix domain-containing protein [Methanocorpusculum sp.]|nr:helix-turn-helix domain-containing protein [Methanocorpusculum sp.]HJJ39970.1 helix-turn-helix domain-containing protein [Methanocorpusculum sp.]HJJ49454.1 helix-turn-helix domain-containing protein [Methanocorpusculum sp.]HJJ57005.1 helix-turn-helix domain-containing protein [Methanocorpusculum sp.]
MVRSLSRMDDADIAVFSYIYEHSGCLFRDIAESLELDKNTLAGTLGRLLKYGMVTKWKRIEVDDFHGTKPRVLYTVPSHIPEDIMCVTLEKIIAAAKSVQKTQPSFSIHDLYFELFGDSRSHGKTVASLIRSSLKEPLFAVVEGEKTARGQKKYRYAGESNDIV